MTATEEIEAALAEAPAVEWCWECGSEITDGDVTLIRVGGKGRPHCDACAAAYDDGPEECDWCGDPCDGRFCSRACRAASESDHA